MDLSCLNKLIGSQEFGLKSCLFLLQESQPQPQPDKYQSTKALNPLFCFWMRFQPGTHISGKIAQKSVHKQGNGGIARAQDKHLRCRACRRLADKLGEEGQNE